MHERGDRTKKVSQELPATHTKMVLNLRRSQTIFLHRLGVATGLEPSVICQRLIDLALQSGPESKSNILFSEAAHAEMRSFLSEPEDGSWVQVPVYLDAKYFGELCSIAANSGVSSSKAMRHLLSESMTRHGISPSLDGNKTGKTRTKPGGILKPQYYSAISIVGALAVFLVVVIFMLPDGRSIKVGPHWAGNKASLIFDPHTHTHYSDGALSPTALVELADQSGCDALVISDHSGDNKSVSNKQILEQQDLRDQYPQLLLFNGIELNIPSYGGREHAGVIASPSVDAGALQKFRDEAERSVKMAKKGGTFRAFDTNLLKMIADYQSMQNGLFLVYNHPSHKDSDLTENLVDITKWNASSTVFGAIEGAPGHQSAPIIGSYEEPHLTEDRWDPVVSEVGGVWDQLLSQGHQLWGALASSDYHNDVLDYAPCAFSRTHLIVPEPSYRGVLMALNAGTFWADHGRILDQFWFSVDVEGMDEPAYPGYTIYVGDQDSIGVVNLSIVRGPGSFGQPLTAEFIGDCSSGNTEILAVQNIPADSSRVSKSIPLAATGQDGKSCSLRARVRLSRDAPTDYLAYSNHVRLLLN